MRRKIHSNWSGKVKVAAIGGVMFALAACASPAPESPGQTGGSAPENLGSIVLGIGSDPATGTYVAAHEQGFFEANGVTSEIRQFASGAEAVAAQVSGEIQLSSVTEPPFLGAFDKGAELGILGTIAVSDQNFGGVVTSDITEAADLTKDGVRVGVTQNSGAHYFLQRYAEENDVSLDEVDLAYLQVTDLVPSFTRGDIQAIFTWTPNVQQAVEAVDGAEVIAYSGDVGFPTTMYAVATNDVIEDTALSAAIVKSLVEAAEWMGENPDEALQMMSDAFSVPADALELPVSLFDYNVDFTQEQADGFVSVAEWMQGAELITNVPDPADFLHPEPLLEVDDSRVTYTE